MQRLKAQLLWRHVKWLPFLKWISESEVDFEDFLVVFDFAKGEAKRAYPNGEQRGFAKFASSEPRRGVHGIGGVIECGAYHVEMTSSGEMNTQFTIYQSDSPEVKEKVTHESNRFRYLNHFAITSYVERGNVHLSIETKNESEDLAVLVASVLVFGRFG